ncbi:MAG: threonine--tRNA ligase [Gammaproteobacteria bacterium]|nr:threonine--tRNA ligase [Gammaproteobacteria bacterium]
MPVITLPDGSQRTFDGPVQVVEVAKAIGSGLAKAALAGRVDGVLRDVSFSIEQNAELAIITSRDDEGLEIIRHSCAHLLAQAVKSLFPSAQVTIGPVIDDGFYYDFAYERPFTPEDLSAIETKMQELVKADLPVARSLKDRDEAIQFFRNLGEEYKAEIIADIPAGEVLSFYQQGDFVDLCRGPHVPSTRHIKAFKLTKVAGAYWRGDSNNEMLQRIYGTAWPDKKQLNAYLHRIEEAEKRDHRKLGKQLDLFHFQPEAPGLVFWHPNGWTVYRQIESYIRSVLDKYDYGEVKAPQIMDRSLWEKSGHWEKFHDDMFVTESENREYALKPMNCPGHVQIFNQGLKSYRDLPIRMAEFGSCLRNEPSGTLHGLMRVRGFTQDDAHIFCTEEQVQEEVSILIDIIYEVYEQFGFSDISIKLSTRPENRVGSDEVWDRSEAALQKSLEDKYLPFELQLGEGAFYGPKIEFSLRDCLNRVWQCGTIQLDFSMPERLGATYIDEDDNRQTPVMIHRAILGSLERFIGILLEHHAGKLPVWLSPVQAVVFNITDKQKSYADNVARQLLKSGVRVRSDLRNEKVGFKIRESTLLRIPYMLIVGDKEIEDETVSVRTREGEELGTFALAEFQKKVLGDTLNRTL